MTENKELYVDLKGHDCCWQEITRLNNHINKLDAEIERLREENKELKRRAVEYMPGDW